MIPVDEFLPIMFDQHQNETWKNAFPNRTLVAWSASPLLVFPTHYTGDEGYLSDTEQSDIINVVGNYSISHTHYTYTHTNEKLQTNERVLENDHTIVLICRRYNDSEERQ